MSKLRDVIKRVFARRHSDIWSALQEYASSKGIRADDALAAAVSAYLAADEEGKETLERYVSERRRSGDADVKAAIETMRQMFGLMGEAFDAINKARVNLQVGTLVSEYEALAQAAEKIKKSGAESGGFEDMVANWFLSRMFGGQLPIQFKSSGRKKTGEAPVTEFEE
jgi:hypothetical protein